MGNYFSNFISNFFYKQISSNNISNISNISDISDIPDYSLYCSDDGIIKECSNDLLKLLLYEKENLVNSSIEILMNPFMAYLHKKILFPKYLTLNNIEKNICHIYLAGITNKRPLIIYNIKNEPIYVNISIKHSNNGYPFCVIFTLVDINIFSNNNKNLHSSNIITNDKITNFKETKNKLIIISIDFRDSTEILVKHGVLNTIEFNKKFHEDIVELIKNYYYPYIYIHEIIGDCFVLVLNMDWSYNISKYCASIALSFIIELHNKTNNYIGIRIGISYGKLYYGYIDDNLRFFGESMNLAARFENQCLQNEVSCNIDFINKLYEESIFNEENLVYTTRNCNLKGFGEKECYFINFDNSIKYYNDIFTKK